MIYLWKLFIEWSTEYPTSAFIADIMIAAILIIAGIIVYSVEKKQDRTISELKETIRRRNLS